MVRSEIRETMMINLLLGRLEGIDRICRYTGCSIPDLMDWILHDDFPARNVDGRWVSKKRDARRWMKDRDLKRFPGHPWMYPPQKVGGAKLKRRRW